MINNARPTKLHQDYMVSFLRSQLATLQSVLNSVETARKYDDCHVTYITESMRRIEQDINRFRKECSN